MGTVNLSSLVSQLQVFGMTCFLSLVAVLLIFLRRLPWLIPLSSISCRMIGSVHHFIFWLIATNTINWVGPKVFYRNAYTRLCCGKTMDCNHFTESIILIHLLNWIILSNFSFRPVWNIFFHSFTLAAVCSVEDGERYCKRNVYCWFLWNYYTKFVKSMTPKRLY